MITWSDAQKLKEGDTIYEEQVKGNLYIFVPAKIAEVTEDGVLLEEGIWMGKEDFPFDNLYMEE